MSRSKSITVIGGGIVGLAVAELAARSGYEVTLLEKENDWAQHQTGHNSGVIHAGPYYKPGSLKAEMCLAGNASMTQFAKEYGIPFQRTGKLIIAVDESENRRLLALADRARVNSVPSRVISGDEAREYEPHISAVQALHVENTGIIDYVAVSRQLVELAISHGAQLVLGVKVREIISDDTHVRTIHEEGEVESDYLINCAGLHSDRIAELAGVTPSVRIVPFRGEYFELVENRRSLVNGLVYPTPDPDLPFLGVHFTRMIDGSVHAGPNAVFALAREAYSWRQFSLRDTWESITFPGFLRLASKNIDTGVSEITRSLSKKTFAKSLARMIPEISVNDIVPAGAGIRAQAINPDGSLADDFVIQKTKRQLHVLNAPSPAATSGLEIAKYIINELNGLSS